MNSNAVRWKYYKQKRSAGSSTEAKYITLSGCIRELRHLKKVLSERSIHTDGAVVYEDKQECIRWTEVREKRKKQIDVRYHVSRAPITSNEVVLEYCSTIYMVADALMKLLGPQKFKYLISMMPMGDSNCSRQR